MSFPLVLGHVASLVLLVYLLIYAAVNRGRPGSRSLIALFSLMLVWASASFAESLVPLEEKLWFRNLSQLGVFCVPAALWSFVRSYTGRIEGGRARWEFRGVAALATLGLGTAVLIATDGWHHLMRREVYEVMGFFGPELVVRSTPLGQILVALNYMVVGLSVLQLVLFALKTGKAVRTQLVLFLLAILVTAGYALYRQMGEATHVPISWFFTLSGLLLALGAFRYDFLRVTPIARNLAFDILEEGIVVCSSDGRIIDLNAAGRALLIPAGGTLEEAGRVLDRGLPDRRRTNRPGESRQTEFVLEGSEGPRTLHMATYPVTTDRDAVLGSVSVIRDVTVLRRQNAILVEKAERDGLTGLFNRATFVDLVERRLVPGAETPVLLVFDVDEFKAINDRFGHLRGDEVLKEVCAKVAGALRESDVFGRLGGDEFAVFLTGLEGPQIAGLAERIRSGVETSSILSVPVTLSLGYVARPAGSFAELYHAADQALYEAKRRGKNQAVGR